ncbi:hypothetical protein IMAU60055_03075 [Lactiplantibacillus plantarum]|nr:hypothetical protein [Lactiplantibacillus plantarum]
MRYNKIEENIGDIEPVVEIVPYNTGYKVDCKFNPNFWTNLSA